MVGEMHFFKDSYAFNIKSKLLTLFSSLLLMLLTKTNTTLLSINSYYILASGLSLTEAVTVTCFCRQTAQSGICLAVV